VFNLLISLLIIVFLNSCGVDTSSSPVEKTSSDTSKDSNTDNSSGIGLDLIDPNPVTSDGNTDNTDNTDNTGTTVADQSNSVFDVNGAVLDTYACLIGDSNKGYTNNIISDTSSDDRSEDDLEYGVLINSKLPLDRASPNSMIVTLFYHDLKPQLQEEWKNIIETDYRLSVDTAWGSNDETTMYVMTPKNSDGYFGCYRYDFSSLSNGTYTKTKVYRNNK
jgi:hypothetical protein